MTRIATPFLDAIAYAHRAEVPAEVLRAWHDDHHTDPFNHCMTEPCATVHREVERADSRAPAGTKTAGVVIDEIRIWHDREHDEPHAVCTDSLCAALRMHLFIHPENQGSLS